MSIVQSVDLNELATDYDEKRRLEPQDLQKLLGYIQHYGKVIGDALEIGCGPGYYLVPLAKHLPSVKFYGLDITDAMLTSAKLKIHQQAASNCSLAKGDAHYLPFADHAFTFILMSQVLHHFSNPEMVAAEVRRATTKEARMLIITSSHLQLRSQLDLALFPGLVKKDISRFPSIEQIRCLFGDNGFKIIAAIEFAPTFRFPSITALIERIKLKPWSSYQLFLQEEFSRKFSTFRANLYKRFGGGEISYLVPQTLLFFQRSHHG